MVMSHQGAAASLVSSCEADETVHNMQRTLESCLKSDPILMASAIHCDYRDGIVVLRGHVRTFHEKQIAQECARKVHGVRMIVNRLTVESSPLTRSVGELIAIRQPSVTPATEIPVAV